MPASLRMPGVSTGLEKFNRMTHQSQQQGVTVVVPTLNRGEAMLPAIADLLAQTHRPLEIMIVEQSEAVADEVLALARAHPETVSLHRVAFRGLPQARNYAWQHARYEAIVFVDDDTRIRPDLAAEHLRALCLPHVGIVAGSFDDPNRPDPGPPTGTFHRFTAEAHRGWDATHEADVEHAPGGNLGLWRSVAREMGGFDEWLGEAAAIFEELEFCLRARRAGYRVYFNGKAHLTHTPAPTGGCRVDKVARQVWGIARNRTMIIRRHLRWYEKPVALARQVRQCAGFARAERDMGVLRLGLEGMTAGWRQGRRAPVCTAREPCREDVGAVEALS